MQTLVLVVKARLIISMLLLFIFALSGNELFQTKNCFFIIGWSTFFGSFACLILALVLDDPIYVLSVEGFSLGFDLSFGMQYKNLFGYTTLISSVCLIKTFDRCKKKSNIFGVIISITLLLLSNSRGAILMLLIFLLVRRFCLLPKRKEKGKLVLWIVFVCFLGMLLSFVLGSISSTFGYRVRGLTNYLNYTKGDLFHLFFGNAEMAFGNSSRPYSENVRSVIGWDGTVELPLLNILIKNGFLGYVGYLMFAYRFFKKGFSLQRKAQIAYFSFLLPFLLSIFVEAYFANINSVYTLFNYGVLNSFLMNHPLSKVAKKKKDFLQKKENPTQIIKEHEVKAAF